MCATSINAMAVTQALIIPIDPWNRIHMYMKLLWFKEKRLESMAISLWWTDRYFIVSASVIVSVPCTVDFVTI
jgi:hypothetical protein